MAEFRMPSLGADMEAGRLIEWRVHPGDVVKRGDIVAVVDTEKAAIEVEIFRPVDHVMERDHGKALARRLGMGRRNARQNEKE